MKIFIPTYNRPGAVKVTRLLDESGIDYRLVLHNMEQLEAYKNNPKLKPEKMLVSGAPVGMSNARQAILDQYVQEGEWCMMLDDNIYEFHKVKDPYYYQKSLPVKERPEFCKPLYENRISAREFMTAVEETIQMANQTGAELCGFASNPNFFYREKKWREVGYVIGKTILIKKSRLRYDLAVYGMDDYSHTAKHLLAVGKVLINNFAVGLKRHYERGGVGTYDERLNTKIADCSYLMSKYPGLFRYKKKQGCHPFAELQVRFNSLKQVEAWREGLLKSGK